MSNEEILTGNKLIANFHTDGKTRRSAGGARTYYLFGIYYRLENLEYHTSWDWMMDACKKWDRLTDKFSDRETYEACCDDLDKAVTRYDIIPAWKALAKNIQWYNQQKITTK